MNLLQFTYSKCLHCFRSHGNAGNTWNVEICGTIKHFLFSSILFSHFADIVQCVLF